MTVNSASDRYARIIEVRISAAISSHADKCKGALVNCMKNKGKYLLYCTVCYTELLTWKNKK